MTVSVSVKVASVHGLRLSSPRLQYMAVLNVESKLHPRKAMASLIAQPLVRRILSHDKALSPCRFSICICYRTGDYSDLKQHITTSHKQPTAIEQTSKSSIPVESASEHQESTSGSDIEEESTKQSKSDHA